MKKTETDVTDAEAREQVAKELEENASVLDRDIVRLGPSTPMGHQFDIDGMKKVSVAMRAAAEWLRNQDDAV